MAKNKFKNVIQATDEAVLVDFFAEWCAPCQTMNPVLDAVVEELGGKLKLYKLNVDKNPQVSLQFGVRSIPHFILFKRGKILWRKGGYMTKKELLQALKGFI
ncbi:thioredoxin [Cecembia rubra]|uniref:Thioredoxin n=1 Tax=Cecembia rubra TaxID=1485585 RepID=A0A2P8E8I6_9BACT|nr:thioredoxin [Cecembia rubra]PSL05785.1 thioredoxin [Cecembia rubra]